MEYLKEKDFDKKKYLFNRLVINNNDYKLN